MKAIGRIFTFLIFVLLVSTSLYFRQGTPPFSAIPSQSMVPTFRVGDLIWVEDVTPANVEAGDIIVVDVPEAVRERFGYPPNIVHRVVSIDESNGSLQYRVKGDNNEAEDPFTVLPKDIMGKVGPSYRYYGYPILFLNSKQGFYFVVVSLIIYILFMISDELKRRDISLRRGIASFLFADVFRRTEEIERGQQQIIDLLTEEKEKKAEEAKEVINPEDDAHSLKDNNEQGQREAAVTLEEESHTQDKKEEFQIFPPRRETRKKRGFFKKR